MFEVTGKLEVIYETQQVSEKFAKREFVLEIQNGMYPEYPKFQITQERCSLLDGYKVGDTLKVRFNLRGRPYEKGGETLYFTNLEAWRVESGDASAPAAPAAPTAKPVPMAHAPMAPTAKPAPGMIIETEDDLPF